MVAVVGMGFAGRMALLRIRAAGIEAVAVDPLDAAVERTRLHEAAARGQAHWTRARAPSLLAFSRASPLGCTRSLARSAALGRSVARSVSIPLAPWLARIGAAHYRARAVSVRPGQLLLDDGTELRCDQIVLAAGSVTDDRGVPGVREHAHHLDSVQSTRALHEALPDRGHVLIAGAGLTGLELATEIAEARPGLRVTMVGSLLGFSVRGEVLVHEALAELKIVHVDARILRLDAREGPSPRYTAQTDQGALHADVIVWAAGMKAPDWLAAAGLPVDAQGRVLVDSTLRVPGQEGIVVAGDCASTPLRMACATAMPMGCHAADTVIRSMRGMNPRPFSFAFVLRCLSLGRSRALMQGTSRDDTPSWALGGRGAVIVKETILRAVASMHTLESAVGLPLYGWRTGGTSSLTSLEQRPLQ